MVRPVAPYILYTNGRKSNAPPHTLRKIFFYHNSCSEYCGADIKLRKFHRIRRFLGDSHVLFYMIIGLSEQGGMEVDSTGSKIFWQEEAVSKTAIFPWFCLKNSTTGRSDSLFSLRPKSVTVGGGETPVHSTIYATVGSLPLMHTHTETCMDWTG